MQGQLEGQEGVHGSELLDMQRKMHDIQRKYKAMQVQPLTSLLCHVGTIALTVVDLLHIKLIKVKEDARIAKQCKPKGVPSDGSCIASRAHSSAQQTIQLGQNNNTLKSGFACVHILSSCIEQTVCKYQLTRLNPLLPGSCSLPLRFLPE